MPEKGLIFEIAGVGFVLRGLPSHAAEVLEKRYGAFSAGAADCEWELEWGVKGKSDAAPEVEFNEDGDGWIFSRSDFSAQWDIARRKGRARVDDSEYSFDALLRIWIASLLVEEGGGLFHAAGVAKDGRGLLFIGRSGAGKSTIARKFKEDEILSDELVAVRRGGDGFRAYGTPFMGELAYGGRDISAPFEEFFILNRQAPTGRRPIRKAAVAAELWGTLMCMSRGYGFLKRAIDLCEAMAGKLPCEEFSYDLNEGPWRLLDERR